MQRTESRLEYQEPNLRYSLHLYRRKKDSHKEPVQDEERQEEVQVKRSAMVQVKRSATVQVKRSATVQVEGRFDVSLASKMYNVISLLTSLREVMSAILT